MNDKQKLQEFLGYIMNELNTKRSDGIEIAIAGLYGDDGHVGDDDEDVVGMMWIEEIVPGAENRCWNVRVKLDD